MSFQIGGMLQINPQDAILFTKAGNELVGMVEITNIIQSPVTYKVYPQHFPTNQIHLTKNDKNRR